MPVVSNSTLASGHWTQQLQGWWLGDHVGRIVCQFCPTLWDFLSNSDFWCWLHRCVGSIWFTWSIVVPQVKTIVCLADYVRVSNVQFMPCLNLWDQIGSLSSPLARSLLFAVCNGISKHVVFRAGPLCLGCHRLLMPWTLWLVHSLANLNSLKSNSRNHMTHPSLILISPSWIRPCVSKNTRHTWDTPKSTEKDEDDKSFAFPTFYLVLCA